MPDLWLTFDHTWVKCPLWVGQPTTHSGVWTGLIGARRVLRCHLKVGDKLAPSDISGSEFQVDEATTEKVHWAISDVFQGKTSIGTETEDDHGYCLQQVAEVSWRRCGENPASQHSHHVLDSRRGRQWNDCNSGFALTRSPRPLTTLAHYSGEVVLHPLEHVRCR